MVFLSHISKRYVSDCSSYECFILRAARLSSKLLGQGYVMERLKSSLRKFYGRYGDLIKQYEVSLSQMLHDILGHDHIQWHTQLIRHLHQFANLLPNWTLRIIWVKCIPLSLRSMTRRRATPLIPTWIYSCRSRVTVSCALPFTTNVTISTSISQTFRSWVAIFHLRQPMVFLSHSSNGMSGIAPPMNVLFVGRPRLSSKLLGQGYVMERLKSSLRKFYGRYGDLIKQYEVSLSQMLHDILGHDHIQWHTQLAFITDLDLITKIWRFP